MKHSPNIQLLHTLTRLPLQMIKMHGTDNISEFVLHELSCKNCFNLTKAAYFVDNPAFNCLKGIAGYAQDEESSLAVPIWHEPELFSHHMKTSLFNQKVRECVQVSCKNCTTPDEDVLRSLADTLGMNSFNYCTWQMKHDNHGYLLYESCDHDKEDLLSGASLLSFCPIF
jgi:hypothetical protein